MVEKNAKCSRCGEKGKFSPIETGYICNACSQRISQSSDSFELVKNVYGYFDLNLL